MNHSYRNYDIKIEKKFRFFLLSDYDDISTVRSWPRYLPNFYFDHDRVAAFLGWGTNCIVRCSHPSPWINMKLCPVNPCPSLPFSSLPCPSLPFTVLICPSLPFLALPCPSYPFLPFLSWRLLVIKNGFWRFLFGSFWIKKLIKKHYLFSVQIFFFFKFIYLEFQKLLEFERHFLGSS